MDPYIKQAIDEWNPMGLLPMAPPDEYDIESKALSEVFQPSMSTQELAETIAGIFTHYFDEPFSSRQCEGAARRIQFLCETGGNIGDQAL